MFKKVLFLMAGMMLSVNGFAQAQDLIQISDTQTWANFGAGGFDAGDTLQILPGGDLTVSGRSALSDGRHLIVEEGGRFTINARFDVDGDGVITMNGGEFHSTVDMKFPDNATGLECAIWLHGGLMVCSHIESRTDRGSTLHVGGGVLRTGGADLTQYQNPENPDTWTIVPIPPYPEVSIMDIGGGWREISAQSPVVASEPHPADVATDVIRNTVLTWAPSVMGLKRDVYFGTDLDAVSNADRGNPLDVLAMTDQVALAHAPGTLEYGRTYYWRIDEVNDAEPDSPWKGEVWAFTVEPYSYPVEGITATASSSLNADYGPERTIDGSGLNDLGEHSADMADMWVSDVETGGAWIQYVFDDTCKLDMMQVWNFNTAFEDVLGWGLKDVTVEYTDNGTDWSILRDTTLDQGISADNYAANAVVDLGGTLAQGLRLTARNNWGELIDLYGLSEVQITRIIGYAREPQPGHGSVGVDPAPLLSWRVGREAAQHLVYVGESEDDLTLVDTVNTNQYDLLGLDLEMGRTYYWRIDEVNDAEIPSAWESDVWNFRTRDCLVVDDFEGYDDDYENYNRVFQIWIDGAGYTQPEPGHLGNGSGSLVGTSEAPWVELDIVHTGRQAMPISYSNTDGVAYSEATRTFDVPQDWTAHGIKSLSLYFQGLPDNGGRLYLKINNTPVPYNGDAADLTKTIWQPWNVDLSNVAADLANVRTLTIGIEDAGATGIVYIDDICLYPRTPEYITPVEPGSAQLLAQYDFEGNANDSSGHGLHGTLKQAVLVNSGRPGAGSAVQLLQVGYVDLGNPGTLDFGTGDWTVTAWIKTAMTGTGDANKGTIYAKGGDAGGGHRYALIVSENQEGVVSLICDDNVTKIMTDSTSAVNDDRWHFVVGQRDGTALRIFIDGQEEGTSTAAADYNLAGTSQHNAYIGAITNHGDGSLYKRFNGLADEVRVYDRALSAGEILWLAGQTAPVAKPF